MKAAVEVAIGSTLMSVLHITQHVCAFRLLESTCGDVTLITGAVIVPEPRDVISERVESEKTRSGDSSANIYFTDFWSGCITLGVLAFLAVTFTSEIPLSEE